MMSAILTTGPAFWRKVASGSHSAATVSASLASKARNSRSATASIWVEVVAGVMTGNVTPGT
jgi:hypothetical protein